MKNTIIILLAVFSILSCKKETKDYVSLTGQFEGLEETDTILRVNSRGYGKKIELNADGTFKDTLRIKQADFYSIRTNTKVLASIYLKKGDDLKISGDITDLGKTLAFKGEGAETNKYIVVRKSEVAMFTNDFKSLASLDSVEFNAKLDSFSNKMTSLLANKELDTAVVNRERKGLEGFMISMKNKYVREHAFQLTFAKGSEAPNFENFEDYKGGSKSMDDFKGKYLFIDVWATWCRPCLAQIPALGDLEEEFKEKNIAFVSISTDKKDKYETWKEMIKERSMTGIQLYAGQNMEFMEAYQITSIPRFIFIDPDGKIIDASAPKPTNKEAISKLFTEAGL